MVDSQAVEALELMAYIGRTRNNVTHTGNGREVHLPRVPNLMGIVYRLRRYLSTWGVFCMGVHVCPIGTTPSATLTKHR
jgi:hypothetical protein